MTDDLNSLFNRPEGAPDGPDFWRLSKVVLKSDGAIEAAEDDAQIEAAYDKVMADAGVSHEALAYLAKQRAYRLLGIETEQDAERQARLIGALAAMFVDGFTVGSGYQRELDNEKK